MTSRVEAVAEILWHRYSPDHEDSWPSPNADEYRRVASDILSTLTVTVERAARLVEEGKEVRDPLDNYQSTIMDEWPSDDEAAAAIRALGRKV